VIRRRKYISHIRLCQRLVTIGIEPLQHQLALVPCALYSDLLQAGMETLQSHLLLLLVEEELEGRPRIELWKLYYELFF